jgi:hypothetical protein
VLGPDRIKPFLLHEDPYVRRAALDYFADSRSRDPEIISLALDAYDRSRDQDRIRSLYACDRLLLTEHALDKVLDHLSGAEDADAIQALNHLVVSTPVELISARDAVIRGTPNIQPKTIARLERRRDLAAWSGEKLWEELQDFAYRSKDVHDLDEVVLSYSRDLVDALARHDVPDEETLCHLLRSLDPEKRPEEGWLEIFLVELAGARRVARAVPALVEKFHIDTDYLLERCKVALARIGDPEACRLIREAYPGAEGYFKLFTSDIFGAIKHEASEDAILALLQVEEDWTYRTILCESLCELFSERGVEVVRREIKSGYDTEWATLEEELLPVLAVLGLDLPDTGRWKKERAARERRHAARLAELDQLGRQYAAKEARQTTVDARSEPRHVALPQGPPPATATTFRRSEPKVGRNDPCPCGSGKKFKKCCGRAG